MFYVEPERELDVWRVPAARPRRRGSDTEVYDHLLPGDDAAAAEIVAGALAGNL